MRTTTAKLVTRESMIAMLHNPNAEYVQTVIGRALVALRERQTSAEQQMKTTNVDNNIGFTQADALRGTRSAEIYLRTGKLLPWVIEYWSKPNARGIPRLAKYWKQLNEAAMAKQNKLH